MNTDKRLHGIKKKRDYLSSQLEKCFHFMFLRLMEVGYCHNDILQFCQHWMSIYNCYEKVNDKLLSMSDDLPF